MLVLSTKPLQKLTGTDGQTGRQADRQEGKPMCREAARSKSLSDYEHMVRFNPVVQCPSVFESYFSR